MSRMKKKLMHFSDKLGSGGYGGKLYRTACGLSVGASMYDNLSNYKSEVTCKQCLAELRQQKGESQ